jgi:hypothetical protein
MLNNNTLTAGDIVKGGLVVGGAAALAFVGSRYKVCRPEQIMVRTGLGIKEMLVSKKGIQ